MIRKIIYPVLISFVLIGVQLVVIPLISIKGIVPNVLLIYLILYSLKNGQIIGTLFAFVIGFVYDLSSGGLLGSGMFAFTISSFTAGYFYKDSFIEILKNTKIFIFLFLLSSILFFFSYSILGNNGVILDNQFGFFLFSILSALYNTLLAMFIYIFRWKEL